MSAISIVGHNPKTCVLTEHEAGGFPVNWSSGTSPWTVRGSWLKSLISA